MSKKFHLNVIIHGLNDVERKNDDKYCLIQQAAILSEIRILSPTLYCRIRHASSMS